MIRETQANYIDIFIKESFYVSGLWDEDVGVTHHSSVLRRTLPLGSLLKDVTLGVRLSNSLKSGKKVDLK